MVEYYGLDPSDISFQQDNDPKHTHKKVKEWTIRWPVQSPGVILLSIFRDGSKGGLINMKTLLMEFMHYGKGLRKSGRGFQLRSVRN